MKRLSLILSVIGLLPFFVCAENEAPGPLPFSVKIGGQAAQVKETDVAYATVDKPVPADAAIEVGTKGNEMTIVNVVAADEKGKPKEGASPQVILIQNGTKTTLDKTMDGKKLAAGTYLMALVTEGKTASVLLKVQ